MSLVYPKNVHDYVHYTATPGASKRLLVDAVLTENSIITVGPTGAVGNEYTWSHLDVIPLEATHVELLLSVQNQSVGTGAGEFMRLYVGPVGQTADATIEVIGCAGTANIYNDNRAVVFVELNSLNQIDIKWDRGVNPTTDDARIFILGYKT